MGNTPMHACLQVHKRMGRLKALVCVFPDGPHAYLCTTGAETFSCLSAVGWIFTVLLTYAGFIMLALGAAWNANLGSKLSEIREKWHELRAMPTMKGPEPASTSV